MTKTTYKKTFKSYDKLITEKNAQGWADWCGGKVVDNNGNIEIEFINKYNTAQRVKLGGIILSTEDDKGNLTYMGTSDENLQKATLK